MGDVLAVLALAALAGAGFGALAGWLLLRSSGPVVSAQALNELARVRTDWTSWKLGADAILEELEGVAQTVERRRARLAARESNASRANGGGGNGGGTASATPAELRARARAAGHPV